MNDLSKLRKNRRRMALDEPYRSRACKVGTGTQRFNQVRLDHQDLGIGEFRRRNPDDFGRPCLQQRSLPGVSAIVNSVADCQHFGLVVNITPNERAFVF